jgi:hypothetical protein
MLAVALRWQKGFNFIYPELTGRVSPGLPGRRVRGRDAACCLRLSVPAATDVAQRRIADLGPSTVNETQEVMVGK